MAQGAGRLPVVVLIHGSSGIGANVEMWSNEFNAMGISTFAIDGFTGRGLTTVGANQAQLGRLNLIVDAYRALDILAKHPRVDSSRIVLMGFSRGAQAALFAASKRFHEAWNTSSVDFAGYVPFYPDCMTSYTRDTETTGKPIRIHHGTPDDYNPVVPCKAYVARLTAAGQDATLSEYPNGQHSFDTPTAPTVATVSKHSQTVRRCVIREGATGQLMNTATNAVFTYQDACVERDPRVGHNAADTQAPVAAVKVFLRGTFKLP